MIKEEEAIKYIKKRIKICNENADVCDDNDFDVIIEEAYKVDDKFIIYANYRDFMEDDNKEE